MTATIIEPKQASTIVLSQSTKDFDQGTKFTYYRSIPELQEYILIDQYSCKIEQFSKNNQGQWLLTEYEKLEKILSLESLSLQLNIADIYEQVKFEDNEKEKIEEIVES